MKLFTAIVALAASSAAADCGMMEYLIRSATKLHFHGYQPNVQRMTSRLGEGNKIVLRGFSRSPIFDMADGVLSITAGEPCEETGEGGDPTVPAPSEPAPTSPGAPSPSSSANSFQNLLGASFVSFFMGRSTLSASTVLGSAVLMALSSGSPMMAGAQEASNGCDLEPIEVEIYLESNPNSIVMRQVQSGDFEVCPPESMYWEHHPTVYGGYKGCVGEKALFPCAQDSQGVANAELFAKYPINWDGTSCVETGFTTETRTFWILWGDPLDKYELNKRTGFNPVVSFPFNRGPYPSYQLGVPVDTALDDSATARAMAKDLLAYIGAFTPAALSEFEVAFTGGAESGMTHIWAAKALEIARTTCNRNIYALMEVPAYGYAPADAAAIVNRQASSFYNSSECLCFADDSCRRPTVTISNRGWLPLTPFPTEMGGDGNMYSADSDSPASPWFESMVFPENPSGKMKTPQLSANRRVCDGVYLWPMYFGMTGYEIPLSRVPDCSAWSFSITKAHSASIRAGFIMFKREPETSATAMVNAINNVYTMTNGLMSEWSWYGQMQIWDMIMSRPMSDPTSWIGAYSEIMEEKWAVVIDGFANCPVLTLTNPRAGAYAWFVYNEPYLGIQTGMQSSFFMEVLGVETTTYNWGFRGANPADYYGANYTTADFTRLQLYRDISVYVEVARRAKIVCSDLDASVGDFISINQWAAGEATSVRRRLSRDYVDREDRKRHLRETIPNLTDRQLERLASAHERADAMERQALSCAPDYTMSCFFEKVGTRFNDYDE